jgi:hypothetical protein
MRDKVEAFAAAAGGRWDFGGTLRRIDRFEEAASALRSRAASAAGDAASRLNDAHMAISRAVNPVLYTCAGPFNHDPAVQFPLFPCLRDAARLGAIDPESDEAGFIRIGLLRESNRIHRALDRATAIANDAF